MAVIFKITFALVALCAIAYAFPSEAEQAKQEVSEVLPKAVEPLAAAENKAHEQHATEVNSTTEEAHSRHKRGCKTVTYKKGGRTITAQKC